MGGRVHLALRGRAMALRITGNRIGQVVLPSSIGLIAAGSVQRASSG